MATGLLVWEDAQVVVLVVEVVVVVVGVL